MNTTHAVAKQQQQMIPDKAVKTKRKQTKTTWETPFTNV